MATASSETVIKQSYVGGHSLYGRTQIFSSEAEITSQNIVSVLDEAFKVHEKNRRDINFLYDYYRGKQPISDRTADARGIANNMVVNHANEIVSFKVGYRCGNPMQYTPFNSSEDIPEKIEKLNKYMIYEGKASKDIEMAEWQEICGTSYYICLPDENVKADDKAETVEDEAPFEIEVLNPRNAFVIYSNRIGKKPLAGVTYWKKGEWTGEDSASGGNMGDFVFAVYTDKEYFEITDSKVSKRDVNNLGMIPIIEFPNNSARLGSFEVVIDLLDALSKTESCRLDGLEGFVQSFIKFINCDINEEEYETFLQMGAIKVSSHEGKNADVDLISKELSQTQSQNLVDDIYDRVLTITGLPNRNGGLSTSDTGSAVMMRDGWSNAETKAKYATTLWEKSERELLKVVCHILSDKNFVDLLVSDISMVFPRMNYENVQGKVQALVQMLDNPWIHPTDAYAHSGLFTDPNTASQNGIKWHEEQEAKYSIEDNPDADENKDKTVSEAISDVPGSGQTDSEDTE